MQHDFWISEEYDESFCTNKSIGNCRIGEQRRNKVPALMFMTSIMRWMARCGVYLEKRYLLLYITEKP